MGGRARRPRVHRLNLGRLCKSWGNVDGVDQEDVGAAPVAGWVELQGDLHEHHKLGVGGGSDSMRVNGGGDGGGITRWLRRRLTG